MQMDGMTTLNEEQIETIIRLIHQNNQKFNTRYKNIMQVYKMFFK